MATSPTYPLTSNTTSGTMPWDTKTDPYAGTTGYTPGTSIGGYTCGACSQWVPTGTTHYCYYTPSTMSYTCPICGMIYTSTSGHTCYGATQNNYQLTQILTSINSMMLQLEEMKKRLAKIEQILDDEL